MQKKYWLTRKIKIRGIAAASPGMALVAGMLLATGILFYSCKQGQKPPAEQAGPAVSLKKGVILVDYREQKKVDVYIDGDLFTSYIYPSDLEKPILYPVRTAEGTVVTRGFPLEPREGERIDHPHQVGVWFNFGDVNGYDFWNNSSAIPEDQKARYGRILHRGVKRAESRETTGILEIAADWQVPLEDGSWHTILQELTIFEFSGDEYTRTIDRTTQLTAQEKEVVFKDNKEGLFAIRVARQLELPSDKPLLFTDAHGNPMEVEKLDNEGVNGNYLNSEGLEGNEVWGKRARWVSLSSNIGEEGIILAMFDHPQNYGYPSYWHARGYGLFSVNNLGARAYDEKAVPVELKLKPGESILFKHRLYISSGDHPGTAKLEALSKAFGEK
jgi:hypothetical protein